MQKLRLQITRINSEIEKAYAKLGGLVYQMYKAGSENEEIVSDLVGEIDGLLAQAQELQEKIQFAKGNNKRCSHCGALCGEESRFCPRCGHPLKQPEAPQQEDDEIIVMLPSLKKEAQNHFTGLLWCTPSWNPQNHPACDSLRAMEGEVVH